MAWLTLLRCRQACFETGFAVALKMSRGMTRIWPTAVFGDLRLSELPPC